MDTRRQSAPGKVMWHCAMFVDGIAIVLPVGVDLLPSVLTGATWRVAESKLAVAIDTLRGVSRGRLLQGGG